MISRAIRPLMRAQAQASSMQAARLSARSSLLARSAAVAGQNKLVKKDGVQQQKILMAAMPQLVPFYFVNEVVAGYAAIVIITYAVTKYWLPSIVRTRLARLFVSKL